MVNFFPTFRAAKTEDVDLVFEWANDPQTRAASFQSESITYSNHVAWFKSCVVRPDRHLLLALVDGEEVAVVRFDNDGDASTAVISINVGPKTRGMGLGIATLQAATVEAARLGFVRIVAFIRPSNIASVKVFKRAGYVEVGTEKIHGQPALRLERSTDTLSD